jgi:hypothetical protein
MRKEDVLEKNNGHLKERQTYNDFIDMFIELKKQYPNLNVEQFVEQLAEALPEARAIILLEEAREKGVPVDRNLIFPESNK